MTESSSHRAKTGTYVKALSLAEYADISRIKEELQSGNVLIVKITPLAVKSIEDVKNAIDELKTHVESVGGDIARLGEERIVVTPSPIKIWRKRSSEMTESTVSESLIKP